MTLNELKNFLVNEAEYSRAEVDEMSPFELANAWLNWEGIIGYTKSIIDVINAANNRKPGGDVTNFMFYVYNKWTRAESVALFGANLGDHIWNKWLNRRGDILEWYSELDNDCRKKIVDRANEVYNK